MRLGFREPFADEPLPLQSSLPTPLLLWQGGVVGEAGGELQEEEEKRTEI